MRISGNITASGLLLLVVVACAPSPERPAPTAAPPAERSGPGPEILWDEWGVPHVYAPSHAGVAYGYGWAQMHSHGNAILRLYGLARGRGAEYWGERHLASDRLLHALGIAAAGPEALAAQPPEFRRYLAAFAEGMNAYARAHPEAIDDEIADVLPVRPADPLRHAQRVLFTFAMTTGTRPSLMGLDGFPRERPMGSNTWAIGPSRTAAGTAMLLQNPHLPWLIPLMRFYEAHLVGPELDVYGATLIGFPVIAIGHNRDLGWSHTVNTADVVDVYRLRLDGDGYRFDGRVRDFETDTVTLRVRGDDGQLATETLAVRRSVHGPVIQAGDTTTLAVRAPMLERHGAARQWWDMGRATGLEEFERAMRRLQIPMFTTSYADRDGRIFYLFNAQLPNRPGGDYDRWQRPVRGDTSATLRTGIHDYDALPRLESPPTGFLQNSNSPPWLATVPSPLRPDDHPAYLAPRWLLLREQRAIELLQGAHDLTLDRLVELRYDTGALLADRLLDDLLPAARASGETTLARAARVLTEWDGRMDADSRGAMLFFAWAREACDGGIGDACGFATPWDPDAPLTTPDGLEDPEAAVAALAAAVGAVKEGAGAIDVAWGDVMRLTDELPGNGAPGDPLGVFHVLAYAPIEDGAYRPVHGDTWVAALEFTEDGPRGRVLLTYGNATRSGSPHTADQLPLLARKEMRPLWMSRDSVEAHLERRTPLPATESPPDR